MLIWYTDTQMVKISHYAFIADIILTAALNKVGRKAPSPRYVPGDRCLGVLPFYRKTNLVLILHTANLTLRSCRHLWIGSHSKRIIRAIYYLNRPWVLASLQFLRCSMCLLANPKDFLLKSIPPQISVVVVPKFNFADMLHSIERYKINSLMVVPPQVVLLSKVCQP